MSQSPAPVRRRASPYAVLLAAITIAIAIITLLGIAPLPLLPDLSGVGQGIVQLATVVAAIAVIIGVLNLISVHVRKVTAFNSMGSLYSGITLLTFVLVLALHFLEARGMIKVNLAASAALPGEPVLTLTLMDALQVVIESALAGLLFFSLVYAAFRLMRRRVTIWNALFLVAVLVVLVGYVLPPGSILYQFRDWFLRIPVGAGTRGLLIGVAIGTVIVGVRVLIGQDRLFRE
ncbi:MAG TPA: hypothetical protein VKQ72_19400 [Aggregatilineales bacterium]|nr:hypothetical protein [Aggregatilineales bacterium]